jgi:hypothetical protein
MAITQLKLETLADVDHGRGAAAVNHVLAIVANDLNERGDDGQERTVTVKLTFKRKKNDAGKYAMQVRASYKLPTLDSAETELSTGYNNGAPVLSFRPETPDNVDQKELFDKDEE